jgi:hypothetical protein
VPAGTTQRRPGLHTESSGTVKIDRNTETHVSWGVGYRHDSFNGGIFISTNISGSCRIYDHVWVNSDAGVGPGGNVEHLREHLGEGKLVQASQLWWMSDRSPHESLPVEKDTYRQFFRLVVGPVSVWYADHSTPNSLGVTPPDDCKIVYGNKFEKK